MLDLARIRAEMLLDGATEAHLGDVRQRQRSHQFDNADILIMPGEDGLLGTEEAEVIAPAIAAIRSEGYQVAGPFPADTLFVRAVRGEFDAVIAAYHDGPYATTCSVRRHRRCASARPSHAHQPAPGEEANTSAANASTSNHDQQHRNQQHHSTSARPSPSRCPAHTLHVTHARGAVNHLGRPPLRMSAHP